MITIATTTLLVALLLTAVALARTGNSTGRHACNGAGNVTVWQLRERMATEWERDLGLTPEPRVRALPRVRLAA